MAFLAPTAAASLRTPTYLAATSRRRSLLPTAVKATAGSDASSPQPILSSLRMAASAAVLLAATSPALACTPSAALAPSPPAPLTTTVSTDDAIPDASHAFEKLIVETACLARIGGADEARARLAAAGAGESCARLLAAQALFVDGKVDEAIAAFEELAREDPADHRPLFCQGVLYLVLGREAESEAMFERCREAGGDTLFADPAMMVSLTGAAAVDAESGEEKAEAEPAQV
ncbi:hypothetical protein U9M48_022391 [Paspalum notatum var. saurae]|uniref:Uncharacterized protein n=1 Tax=Paspalum notatum var. saurae TaxID=547442 RepID=A0AAQ3TJM3_PASNO